MKKVKISLNEIEIVAEVAVKESDMYKGLSGRESMSKNEGMLFIWEGDVTPVMVMRDMNFPLDFISLDGNNVITQIATVEVDNKDDIPFPTSRAVLEVNKGIAEKAGLEIGGTINIDKIKPTIRFKGGGTTSRANKPQEVGSIKFDLDKSKVNDGKLYLLDNDGEISMELEGNERIFSIPHTKKLFKEAVEARKNNDYKQLGSLVKEIMAIHDSQEPEYAEEI